MFAFVPLHFYGGVRGDCLVTPRAHFENVLDVPDDLGKDFLRVTRTLAIAMQGACGAGARRRTQLRSASNPRSGYGLALR